MTYVSVADDWPFDVMQLWQIGSAFYALITRPFGSQYESVLATMKIHELAQRLESMHPESDSREVARACLLLANGVDSLDELSPESRLSESWQEVGLRLQVASDQHAAVTQELEDLAASDPEKFSPDQIWVLVRAIKVQSQVLQMYLGESVLDV